MATQTLSDNRVLRVAVIVAPFKDFYATPHRHANLGAHTVESILKSQPGCSVSFFDFSAAANGSLTIGLPPQLNHLKPFIIDTETGPTSFFTRYHYFGLPINACVDELVAAAPDLCCICSFAFCYAATSIELCQAIKKRLPHTKILAGGSGVSCFPEYFLTPGSSIDFACVGEAEVCLPPFMRALQTGAFMDVPNLLWRDHAGSVHTSPVQMYTQNGQWSPRCIPVHTTKKARYYSISLSRGCGQGCAFCSNHLTFGTAFRRADLHTLSDEVDFALGAQDGDDRTVFLNFEDDNILLDAEYFFAVCRQIRERHPFVQFLAENGLDYRLLTPGHIDTLIDGGFAKLNLSLASTDPVVLKAQARTSDQNHYSAVVNHLAQRNIPSVTYFICGFAQDTPLTIATNLVFLSSTPTLIGISPYYAVPGIAGFTDRELFYTIPPAVCAGSACYPWNNSLSTQTIITAFRLSRFINLLKSKRKNPEDQQVANTVLSINKLHTVIKDAKNRIIMPVQGMDEELVAAVLPQLS